jgi:hypothetical protein
MRREGAFSRGTLNGRWVFSFMKDEKSLDLIIEYQTFLLAD